MVDDDVISNSAESSKNKNTTDGVVINSLDRS